jgi:hypothetical protein
MKSPLKNYPPLIPTLTHYLNHPPLKKTDPQTEDIELSNFTSLSESLTTVTNEIVKAGLSAVANVDIIDNNVFLPNSGVGLLLKDTRAGSLRLRNKSRIPYTATAGTKIHHSPIEGIVYSIAETFTIEPFAQAEVPIQVNGRIERSGKSTEIIAIEGVNNPNNLAIAIIVPPQPAGCEIYMAMVVDESGSINQTEAQQIRAGLTAFINAQLSSNITLSMIGMSESDTNNRTDHVLERRIATNSAAFLTWINNYRTTRVGPQADYWASGLSVINQLNVVPDIIIIITDGLQINRASVLQNLYTTLNNNSHIFVIGLNDIWYQISTGFVGLVETLTFYLNRPPILKTNANSILVADYTSANDFTALNSQLVGLTNELVTAGVGCNANVDIIRNLLIPASYNTGVALSNVYAGMLELRNKSRIPLTLNAGTRIHSPAAVNGLVFTLRDTVTLPANSVTMVAIIINGVPISAGGFSELISIPGVNNPSQFRIEFAVVSIGITLTEKTALQSGDLYLQAAGSTGKDSTTGIHLRWLLRGALAAHLPKADYAREGINFNKPNDYVQIYKGRYANFSIVLDFNNPPDIVEDSNSTWIYRINNKTFHVFFSNIAKYIQVRAIINPALNPLSFVKNYGDDVIEVENRSELAFGVAFELTESYASNVKIELLSVEKNVPGAPKTATYRRIFTDYDLVGKTLWSENIRCIRFKPEENYVGRLRIELYSLLIQGINNRGGWNPLGQYALTLDTGVAFSRLEPASGMVNGQWLRYNDGACVNIENYQDRWGAGSGAEDKIRTVVDRYIALSNDPANPLANEIISFNDPNQGQVPGYEPDPDFNPGDHSFEVSNLYLLNLAAMDYHIARMLGLGTLDTNNDTQKGHFVYLAAYTTFGDLKDGLGPREVQHLYTSLPVSLTDERLPIPIDLKQPVPGIFIDNGTETPAILTDAEGYSPDGKTHFITLYNEPLPFEKPDAPFFYHSIEFASSENTLPVYAGLEYRKNGNLNWQKPELSFHKRYFNIDNTGVDEEQKKETVAIIIPEHNYPLYVHRERNNGIHEFSSYGINWFSRARSSNVIRSIETILKTVNTLQPPTNINAHLIQKENPLAFTSAREQNMFSNITADDKTLIRLSFEYTHGQEMIDYHTHTNEAPINGMQILPDNQELFAEEIQIFFRNEIPAVISGKVISADVDPANYLLCKVKTGKYDVVSSGINPLTGGYNESYTPAIPANAESRFIGSILLIDEKEFVVHQIDNTGPFPEFTVLRARRNGEAITLNTSIQENELIKPSSGDLFMLVENMLSTDSWLQPNPNTLVIKPEPTSIYSEEVFIKHIDGNNETHFQKFRGVFQTALVEEKMESVEENGAIVLRHRGLYKISFPGFSLAQHSQYNAAGKSVEFYNGVVRLHTEKSFTPFGSRPKGVRKDLKVIATENIGTTNNLIVYAADTEFPPDGVTTGYDLIKTGNVSVNYYPGYKAYLYSDLTSGITKDTVLPSGNMDVRYSIFGLRSRSVEEGFVSKLSAPVLLFAQSIKEPVRPQKPTGGLYATRPDFFGKASYTFTTKYGTPSQPNKPHAVQFNRASDIQFLAAIYDNRPLGRDTNNIPIRNTVEKIVEDIFLGGEEPFFTDRWADLLGFDYPGGVFATFDSRTLPMPDSKAFIDSINAFVDEHNRFFNLTGPNAVLHLPPTGFNLDTLVIPPTPQNAALYVRDFVKDILLNCFVPLTEIPVIYEHVNGGSYVPIPKKQQIRDSNGQLLKPGDPGYDIAPMMKRLDAGGNFESQFTDFGLDGASNARYFYAVREINAQMKTSDYSPIIGPVTLVNTAPPPPPEIIKVIPVLENRALGSVPAIQLQMNAYPKVQNIRKINIYRAANATDALSIRTMTLVRTITLDIAGLTDESVWTFEDDFSDLTEVPYGDALFYRLTVSRVIRYNDAAGQPIVDYTPSEASRQVITNIAENYSPPSPQLRYTAETFNPATDTTLQTITLQWDETAYKANYHIYKMASGGNWVEIGRIIADRTTKGRYLIFNTDAVGNWVNTLHPDPLLSIDGILYLPLELTNPATGSLTVRATDGTPIYHHYKVLAENTAGMFSREEKILSLYNADSYQAISGIGDMVIGGTFMVR